MTRHAKASSAGSTQGRSNRSGSFARGAGAGRGYSSDADGSGAPADRGRLAAFSVALALLALALFASSALASKQVISDFGNLIESGSFGGELNNPRDIAVNESGVGPANAGDTYVADEANNRIERFDAQGNFVSAWGKDTIASSINERQRIVVQATAGAFTLSFEGSTTTPIANGAEAEKIRGPLEALPGIGSGNVSVSGRGSAVDPFVVTFIGSLGAADQPTITADTTNLSGTVEISTIANGTSTVVDDTGTGFEICTVATECQAGTASGANGALANPQSVVVDQDTGNVYVSDRGNRRIDEYDGEGNFIRAFGWDVTESGPDETGTEYEVCEEAEGDACKAGEAGAGAGQYGEGFVGNGFGIAVSPADGNASTGTVYLADSGNRRVSTFDLDGTSPSSFGSSANFGEEQPRSVAVDSRGIVYASDSNNGGDIQRYDSANADGNGVGFLAPIVPPGNESQEVSFSGFSTGDNFRLTCPNGTPTEELAYAETGIFGEPVGREIIKKGLEAACGAGSVSVSGNPPTTTVTFQGALGGSNQPQMTCTTLSGSGSCSVTTTSEGHPGPLLTVNDSTATIGLAVNPAGTVLYVLRDPSAFGSSTVVQQLGPVNEPGLSAPPTATDDTHGTAAHFEAAVHGFGFDSADGRLFISVNGDPDGGTFPGHEAPLPFAHRVYVLDDASSLPSPTAGTPSVTAIATRTAIFNGEVDPEGGLVGCKFQYSTDEVTWTDVSAPGCAALHQSGGPQNIGQAVSGLAPDTHYFLRLQVTRPYFSEFTPVTSGVQSFTTASGPPLIAAARATAVDEHSVRVSATVDPSHSPTTYVVQYGTTPALGSSTEAVSVGAGTQPIEVSPVIGGLDPATTYYFKIVATNLVGSTSSEQLSVATFPATPSFGSCPNDLLRTGPSAHLPDCRAYEQATPADKFGSDAYGGPYTVEASALGDGITSYTFANFPGSDGFQIENFFLSRFADGAWSTAGLNPPAGYDNSQVLAWTTDLRLSFASARVTGGASGAALMLRDSTDGSRTIVIPQGSAFPRGSFKLGGAFDDDSKVVFKAGGEPPVGSGPAPVSAAGNVYLYDRETGSLTLAGLLPDSACGTPPCVPAEGSEIAAGFESYTQDGHAVSTGGDVYFTDVGTGGLYLRREAAGPGASTVAVSASERTDCADQSPCNGTPEPDPAGTFPPQFFGATPDGSLAFFGSEEKLTDDAGATAGAKDLYRFDKAAPAGGRLTDLVPGAGVLGLAGYSDNGNYVYFAANADLDGGGPAQAGDCAGVANTGSEASFSGSCSIYLWQAQGVGACATAGGCVSFVDPIDADHASSGDGPDWAGGLNGEVMKASRVSADGRILVFRSQNRLTAYDNRETPEFYRYEAESGQTTCLTCNPTGAPPIAGPGLKNPDMFHANTSHSAFESQPVLSRNLSSNGKRFFFQSPDKLVPADVNGEASCSTEEIVQRGAGLSCTDVYEWEAPGEGSCTEGGTAYSPANGGCIYLLSTGTGPYPSYLADVSESGDTAFIFSRQQLVPSDEDTQEDLYAVKVDGGLTYQHAARPANCEGDACRGASSKPTDAPGAGTAAFQGPGNPKQNTNQTRCPKGKRTVHAKGKVRCVAKHKKHAKHKGKAHKRAANNNRRASR